MNSKTLFYLLFIVLFCSCTEEHLIDNQVIKPTKSQNAPLNLVAKVKKTKLPERELHEMIFFKGSYWFMGGLEPKLIGKTKENYNDIWKSNDGFNWVKVLDHAPWKKRHGFNLFIFKGELWIVGGKSGSLNNIIWHNDIWKSNDGINWTKVLDKGPWSKRLFPSVQVFKNKMYLIGGHTETNWHINQDVWESPNGINWKNVGSISDATLGNTKTRQGIFKHGLITFKNKFFLIGGYRATNFNGFDWVLESKNGKDWGITSKKTPWLKQKYILLDHLKPFIFKGRLMIVVTTEEHNKTYQRLYSSLDGKSWKKELELPNFEKKHFLEKPRVLIKNDRILIFGSYKKLIGTQSKQTHIIELTNK